MENRLVKKGVSLFLVMIMAITVFSIPGFAKSNEVNADEATLLRSCSVSVPAFGVNRASTITLKGIANSSERIIPYSVIIDGLHSYYDSKFFNISDTSPLTASHTFIVDRPDDFVITVKFVYQTKSNGRWSSKTYPIKTYTQNIKPKVVLNANKGKINKKSSVTMTYNLNTSLKSLPKPKRKGFKFMGWYTDKQGFNSSKCGTGYNLVVKDLYYTKKESNTVYAHWSKKIKVKLNPRGGKLAKKKRTKKVTYKSVTSYTTGGKYGKLPTPKRSGKFFKGWYTKKKGGKRVYSSDLIKKSKNHTLFAQWY